MSDCFKASGVRRCVLACLALSCYLAGSWLLNVTAYPSFNDFFPAARDVATVVAVVSAVLFARVATVRPAFFAGKGILAGVFSGLLVGCVGMFWAAHVESAILASLFASLRAMVGVVVYGSSVLMLMDLGIGRCLAVTVGAYCLKYLWMALLTPLPQGVLSVVFVIVQLGCALAFAAMARPVLVRAGTSGSQEELGATNPFSFLPLTSWLFVAITLLQAASGFAITYGSQNSYPQPTVLAFVVFVAVAVFLLVRRTVSLDALYALAFALVLAGLILVSGVSAATSSDAATPLTLVGSLANVLLEAGSGVIGIAVWTMAVALGLRNEVGALPVAFVIATTRNLATELGAASGHLQNYLEVAQPELAVLFVAGIAFSFALYNFMLVRRFSFDATVAAVRPVQAVPQLDERVGAAIEIDCRVDELVAAHALTPREAEVFALLAHGRNAAYIQESLTISRNTVKSYVARVYGKLGVHSHQELIDLVEDVAEG